MMQESDQEGSVPEGLQTIDRTYPDEIPLFGGARARRLARRRRILTIVAIGLALALAGGTTFVLTQRNKVTAISLDEAVKQFRTAPRPTAVSVQEESPARTRTRAKAKAAATDAQSSAVLTAVAPHAITPAFSLPAEGVYTYKTKGGESISMFGAHHTYPDETHATVRHLGGCQWKNTNEVIKEHTDERVLCSRAGSFLQLSQGREISFFGQRDGQTYVCTPPTLQAAVADKVGATWTGLCESDDGSKAEIKRTFVGRERMNVDGDDVDSVRIRLDATMTGRAVGTATENFWLAPRTGLPIRWERLIDTMANTAWGTKVRYQENATFVLESLDPDK